MENFDGNKRRIEKTPGEEGLGPLVRKLRLATDVEILAKKEKAGKRAK